MPKDKPAIILVPKMNYIAVRGKGDKERIVYFDAGTKIHLKKYLNKIEILHCLYL